MRGSGDGAGGAGEGGKLYIVGDFWLTRRGHSPRYYIAWHDKRSGGRRSKSTGTCDFQQAQQILLDHALKHTRIRDVDPSDLRLETVWLRYYDGHAKDIASEEAARIALAYFTDFFAGDTISELTPERQEEFHAHLRKLGLSEGYISRILSVGRAALNWAWKRGMVRSVPFVADVQTSEDRRQAPPRGRPLTLEELGRLFDAATSAHLLMFLRIALNTLSRPGAILDLRRPQVDFDNRLVDLNPEGRRQTKKYRPIVPLTDSLLPFLRAAPDLYEKRRNGRILGCWPLEHFVTCYGKPLASIKKAWCTARKDAKLDKAVTPYSIRHTLGRELRRRRVPAAEISILLGHMPVDVKRTDLTYSPFDPDYCQATKKAIEAVCDDLQRHTARRVSAAQSATLVQVQDHPTGQPPA